MARKSRHPEALPAPLGAKSYGRKLRQLQIELVKLQREVIARGLKVVVIFEGRDCAGKDGTIKRIAAHLSPREVRVVAPGKPSSREESEWYFQRFVPHLPAAQEIVLFNRSWYNRAGVEYVMKFCSRRERDATTRSSNGRSARWTRRRRSTGATTAAPAMRCSSAPISVRRRGPWCGLMTSGTRASTSYATYSRAFPRRGSRGATPARTRAWRASSTRS